MPKATLSLHPLREWRTRNGITLAKLAELCGLYGCPVTLQALSDIERFRRETGKNLALALEEAVGGALSFKTLMTFKAMPARGLRNRDKAKARPLAAADGERDL